MWNLFDSRTLFFAAALVSGAVAPLMFLTMFARRTFPGWGRWTASIALASGGLFLMGLRGVIPDLVSAALGNLLVIVALLLATQGIRMFSGQPRPALWVYVCCAALYSAQMYYLFFVRDSFPARGAMNALAIGLICIYTALPLLRKAPAGCRFGYRFTAGVLLFSIPQALLRLASQVHPKVAFGPMDNVAGNILYYSSILLFIVGLGFSFFLLTNERLVAELRVANESLRAETDERLRIQERLINVERMAAIERLAGGISHIFNNQMCIIQLNCELLLDSQEIPDSLRPALNRISSAGERSAEITARLLQFARCKALKSSTFEMTRWLHTLAGDLQRVLGDSIELQIASTDPNANVYADADQLAGVLLALARNARYAMPSGGKWTLLVEAVQLTETGEGREFLLPQGEYIRLSATDMGCGMDEETVKRIFEPFYSTKSLAVAEGLGLASAFGLLQRSGGTMSAESTVGVGSTMRLYLPKANSVPN
jgi:signal transduction histidine kinase